MKKSTITMSDLDKESLKQKKQELESELKSIQGELDDSLDKVKSDVTSTLDPIEHVRRHPLPAVGIAVVVGFLAGKEGGERSHRRRRQGSESSSSTASTSTSSSSAHESESKREKLTSTLWYEVKRLAARKAFSLVSDYIDDMVLRR